MAEFLGWPSSGAFHDDEPPETPHPLVAMVRAQVQKYRLQSVAHFAQNIQVHATKATDQNMQQEDLTRDLRMMISFDTYNTTQVLECRPQFRKKSQTHTERLCSSTGRKILGFSQQSPQHVLSTGPRAYFTVCHERVLKLKRQVLPLEQASG